MKTTTPALGTLLISASVRAERIGDTVADWVANRLGESNDLDLTRIDLVATSLPDDAHLAPGGTTMAVTTSAAMHRADAFVIVTPEYNHSIPASLKRFIDWHYAEWQRKALMIVTYGAGGGVLAGEHLRSISAELGMVAARTAPAIAAPWDHLTDGLLTPPRNQITQLDRATHEFVWWAQAARNARLTASA